VLGKGVGAMYYTTWMQERFVFLAPSLLAFIAEHAAKLVTGEVNIYCKTFVNGF
jgi:uncharacterized protein affecting Mg2+/Co2+ transport